MNYPEELERSPDTSSIGSIEVQREIPLSYRNKDQMGRNSSSSSNEEIKRKSKSRAKYADSDSRESSSSWSESHLKTTDKRPLHFEAGGSSSDEDDLYSMSSGRDNNLDLSAVHNRTKK